MDINGMSHLLMGTCMNMNDGLYNNVYAWVAKYMMAISKSCSRCSLCIIRHSRSGLSKYAQCFALLIASELDRIREVCTGPAERVDFF